MIDAQTLVEMQDRFDELAREGWPAPAEIRRERNRLATAICMARRGDVTRTLETRASVRETEWAAEFQPHLLDESEREALRDSRAYNPDHDDRDYSPDEFDPGEGDFID